MPPLRHVPPYVAALVVSALLLTGCGALGPLQDLEAGPGAARPRPATQAAARPAHAAPTTTRPAPAASPAARPSRPRETARAAAVEVGGSVSAEAPVLAGAAALAQHLRHTGEDWIGTPYRFGGQSRSGIDCSAFVRALMEEAVGLDLPRNTALQVGEGEAVSKDDLLPGDLVFFRRRGTRHVGVYLGAGEFIHASSSNGVIVSRLDEGYYERHYWTSRRVLDDPQRFVLSGDGVTRLSARTGTRRTAPATRHEGPTGSAW